MKSWIFCLGHIIFLCYLANALKAMLQDMDGDLISKDNLIREQTGKLDEKDKVIQTNKAELERLEKRTKMQEHKVRDSVIYTSERLLVLS